MARTQRDSTQRLTLCGVLLGVMLVLGFVELGARMITSFYSIAVHNYYIAVASDPFAWIAAAVACVIIARVIFKRIEKKWADEDKARAENGAV